MITALWAAQGVLAVAFLIAGSFKAFAFDRFADQMDWAEPMGEGKVRGIGAAEIAGVLGLILPLALGVAEFLTPLAALGLAVVAAAATVFHARRGEPRNAGVTAALLALAAFVAWGRWDLLAG